MGYVKDKTQMLKLIAERAARKRLYKEQKVSSSSSSSSESEDEKEVEETGVIFSGLYNDESAVDLRISSNSKKDKNYDKKLNDMIAPVSRQFNMDREYRKIELLCTFFAGASHRTHIVLRHGGALAWIVSMVLHFAFDVNEAVKLYGYTFLAAQFMWLLNFVVGTLSMKYRVLPWLLEGLKELRHDECYEKTITGVLKAFKKIPYLVVLFGLFGSGAQHLFLYIDNAFNNSYDSWIESDLMSTALHVVRYLTAAHIYSGYMLFWAVPTTVMMLCGHAMSEFLDQFDAKIRDTSRVTSFKEAISLYSKRAKFVKTSSSKCLVILSMQLLSVIICFGLNTYVFLFSPVRRFLHVWHSIVPLLVMIYPLCTAAWVTKQYTWFIIVVVRAWVHRDDLDSSSSSEEDSGIEEMKSSNDRKTFQNKSPFGSSVAGIFNKSGGGSRPKSAHFESNRNLSKVRRVSSMNTKTRGGNKNILAPWQKVAAEKHISNPGNDDTSAAPKQQQPLNNTNPRLASTVAAATAINKFKKQATKNRPRFNFEKFLSYLESMRNVVGFSIAGIMVTWDLVSTTLFLLFSIIAVFMQESIFGSQKSTLS